MAEKKQETKKSSNGFAPWRWIRRMFMGASKELSQEEILAVEKLESPSKLAVKAFFRRKLAVVALIVLISLFAFVFIGPLFLPMDVNFTDANQANIGPVMSMRSVPSGMKNQIRTINGYANFTVGVSEDNTLYIWGYSKDALTKVDYSKTPEEIQNGKVYLAATGRDHVIAVTTDGQIVGWGDKSRGQYGVFNGNEEDPIIQMPDELLNGKIEDVSKISSLACGYQASAIVIDGKLYAWGNTKACLNLEAATKLERTDVKKVVFSNYYILVQFEDGSISCPGGILNNERINTADGTRVKLLTYLKDQTVVDIAATKDCFAVLLDSGEVIIQGASKYNEDVVPELPAGEKLVSVSGGANHFVGVSDAGKAYAWGSNDKGQCDKINGQACATAYTGAYQTYLVDENGSLVRSAGLRGYLFGTDSNGRDTFTRIMHGGKMTMTIGAVAVIVSSVIAIIIGCLSGYFGGWVDMVLMRITEIFSAIPFLPFAMMLSYVLSKRPISENMRIFIIMIILGLLSWTGLARMIRGQVLAEREKEFVTAAKSMGVKEGRIAFKHILPNVISVILVSMTLDFAGCLLTESSLSYLGFGVQQPRPTWGNMLNGANNSIVIQNYWWQWVFPAIFLAISTISINIIGDTLRDVLDPKSSQEK